MELKESLKLISAKDTIEEKRHKEKVELAKLKFELATKLIDKRAKFSEERHKERMEIITARL